MSSGCRAETTPQRTPSHPSSKGHLLKRQAAIVGATPPLLRWTIARPCELKDEVACQNPDAAFRQLRNLRTLSVARVDQRIVDGFALMPPEENANSKIVRGFPVNEILELSGGGDRVADACGRCQANVSLDRRIDGEHGWAGCFGWLPFHDGDDDANSSSFEFMQLLGEHDASTNGEIVDYQTFDRIAATFGEIPASGILTHRDGSGDALQPSFSPWFSIWSVGYLNRDARLKYAHQVFQKLLVRFEQEHSLIGVARI